ncbi:hypothetical protein LIP_0937 [Limnochorda pilosa]|uniref:HTH tetR-type domain-containing protein n=1 Tax=Limnochorda pilosa TaxID=1555112 RepID=A0A0K2SIY7_LIMPI|nr:TetR family transcriptional regulator [Limnochorda pilosa]BAS26794.1 hypothetical protein LIP_0937 [Limnochorda pilosa]
MAEAALACFREVGYERATVEEITCRAGVVLVALVLMEPAGAIRHWGAWAFRATRGQKDLC